jgi:hypothetical protein
MQPIVVLLYQHWMTDGDDFGAISEMNEWQGIPKYSEKTCPCRSVDHRSYVT